jgi:hypothetical protein
MNELAKELLSVLTDEMIERRGNVMLFHYGCCDGILIAEMRVYYTTFTSHNEVILSNYAACRGEGTKELKRALEEAISKNIKIYFHIYQDNPEQQKLLYRAEIKSYFISKDDTIFISNIENLDEIKNPFGKTIINNLKDLSGTNPDMNLEYMIKHFAQARKEYKKSDEYKERLSNLTAENEEKSNNNSI